MAEPTDQAEIRKLGDPGYRSTRQISEAMNVPPAVIDHFIEGMATSKNNPRTEGAKWGLTHSQAQAIAAYAKWRIKDMREGLSGACATVAAKSLLVLDERMSDPGHVAEMSTREIAQIGKAMLDAGSTLDSNKIDTRGGGGGSVTNIGELKVLIQMREEGKRVSIEDRLREIGKDPEKYLREAEPETGENNDPSIP